MKSVQTDKNVDLIRFLRQQILTSHSNELADLNLRTIKTTNYHKAGLFLGYVDSLNIL